VKEGIKDLIQSCHCLSHPPDCCFLIGPKASDMMHRYSPSLLKAPSRRHKWFPWVLWVASATDLRACTYYDWWMSPDKAMPEEGMCISNIMTSSAQAVTVRAILEWKSVGCCHGQSQGIGWTDNTNQETSVRWCIHLIGLAKQLQDSCSECLILQLYLKFSNGTKCNVFWSELIGT